MKDLNRVGRYSKKRNVDNLVGALSFLFTLKHMIEIYSSNFNSIFILAPNSFTLLFSQNFSLPILTHTYRQIVLHLYILSEKGKSSIFLLKSSMQFV